LKKPSLSVFFVAQTTAARDAGRRCARAPTPRCRWRSNGFASASTRDARAEVYVVDMARAGGTVTSRAEGVTKMQPKRVARLNETNQMCCYSLGGMKLCTVNPPSMGTITPLTYELAGMARKATTEPTS